MNRLISKGMSNIFLNTSYWEKPDVLEASILPV